MMERMENQAELDDQASLFLRRTFKITKYTKSNGKINLRGRLLRSYVLHLLAKVVLEALFIAGQYFLYGFTLEPRYVCTRFPCPHKVDCFLSRPTEKSVIIWFMLVAAVVSLALSVAELLYLCVKAVRDCMARRQDYTVTPVTPPVSEKKNIRNRDEMIQNYVNLDLELQGRKVGMNGIKGGAKTGSSENNIGEIHIWTLDWVVGRLGPILSSSGFCLLSLMGGGRGEFKMTSFSKQNAVTAWISRKFLMFFVNFLIFYLVLLHFFLLNKSQSSFIQLFLLHLNLI